MPTRIKLCANTEDQFEGIKRVTRHVIRRMTDNTMVKRKKNKTTTNGRQNSPQKTTD